MPHMTQPIPNRAGAAPPDARPKAIVRHLEDTPRVGWPDEQVAIRGRVTWQQMLGGGAQEGTDLTLGVVRLRPGETLEPHRHSQAETYYTLAGRGLVTVEGEAISVSPGTLIHIPADATHCIENHDTEELQILYVFTINDFSQVVYRFDGRAP
jgi:quercetin dioxygenase-like cupin family protein